MTPETRTVDASDWRETVGELAVQGYRYLDLLTAVDRGDRLDILCHVLDPDSGARLLLVTSTSSAEARIASVAGVLPGAAWHERETAEMFGIDFAGHPDPRPLLTRGPSQRPPLVKSTPLVARVTSTWPGLQPGAARRREQVPGVPDPWRTAGSVPDTSSASGIAGTEGT